MITLRTGTALFFNARGMVLSLIAPADALGEVSRSFLFLDASVADVLAIALAVLIVELLITGVYYAYVKRAAIYERVTRIVHPVKQE